MREEKFLTTGDVARLRNCSPDRVRQMARSGDLPTAATAGSQRLFRREDVDRLGQKLARSQAAENGTEQA